MLPEVRMARVLDAIVSHRAGRLSCVEAGELLGLSERHFRRLRDAYEDRGEEGLVDRRRGRVSSSRVPEAEAEWLAEMFRTRYFDFTTKHFHERVVRQPMADGKPFHRSYSCVKSVLQLRGLTTKAPRPGVHRRNRERRPLPGMMLFQDGSQHAWLCQGPKLDLIVTMDTRPARSLRFFYVRRRARPRAFAGCRRRSALIQRIDGLSNQAAIRRRQSGTRAEREAAPRGGAQTVGQGDGADGDGLLRPAAGAQALDVGPAGRCDGQAQSMMPIARDRAPTLGRSAAIDSD